MFFFTHTYFKSVSYFGAATMWYLIVGIFQDDATQNLSVGGKTELLGRFSKQAPVGAERTEGTAVVPQKEEKL